MVNATLFLLALAGFLVALIAGLATAGIVRRMLAGTPKRESPAHVGAGERRVLAALSDEQQVAIIRALRDEMAAEGKKAARTSLWSNLLFFVAGVLASIAVTLLVHPL